MNISEERVGKLLFGRPLRLRLGLWVLGREDPVFFQGEAVSAMNDSANAVSQELDKLVALGLVLRVDRDKSTRRQYYTRTDHALWGVFMAAGAALGSDATPMATSSSPPGDGW